MTSSVMISLSLSKHSVHGLWFYQRLQEVKSTWGDVFIFAAFKHQPELQSIFVHGTKVRFVAAITSLMTTAYLQPSVDYLKYWDPMKSSQSNQNYHD